MEERGGKTEKPSCFGQLALLARLRSERRWRRPSAKLPLWIRSEIFWKTRRGFKVSALVKKYELAQSTISMIMKTGSATIMKARASSHADQRKRVRDPLYADIEEALYKCFLTTRAQNVPITGPILAAKAKKFAFLFGRENFKPGGG